MTDETKYQHIVRAVLERPWAIQPSMLALIVDILRFRASGGVLAEDEVAARIAAAQNGPRRGGGRQGTVAVIPIYGVIMQRQQLMRSSGGTSVEGIASDFRTALASDEIDGIVFDVDSPGGAVDGIAELAAEIRAARGGDKPIAAVANTAAYSAAYWLASQAEELIVTPSGGVGSIGIYSAHQDLSKAAEQEGVKTTLISAGKYKVEGNPWEPLSDEARAAIQDLVDTHYAMFTTDVAKARGVGVADVRGGFGEGRAVLSKKALDLGMVDRVDTLANTIKRVARGTIGSRGAGTPAVEGATVAPLTADDLGSGQPFADRLELVLAAAEDLAAHATARAALRADEGRSLSEPTRERLRALAESLSGIAATPEPSAGPEDGSTDDDGWRLAARNRLSLARAELDF